MKKIIFLTFALSVLINTPAYAGSIELDFSERRPLNAAVRSALMPGWGQGWNNQPTKAWITFGVFAVSVIGAFYFNAQAFDKYDKYENSPAGIDKYYNEYEDNYKISQALTFVAIGTWLYSVIDAYLVCKRQVSEGSAPVSSFKFHYNRQNDGYYLTYSKKIDI